MTLLKTSSRPISCDFQSIVIDNGEEVFSNESAQFMDEIMSRLPPNRQILLFTSEIRNSTIKFQKEYLNNAAEFDFMNISVSDAKCDQVFKKKLLCTLLGENCWIPSNLNPLNTYICLLSKIRTFRNPGVFL